MKKYFLVVIVILISQISIVSAQNSDKSDQDKIQSVLKTINSDDLYAYVDTLSSDVFEGRLTGHVGYDKSADWVISKFKKWGINPLGTNNTYLQKFPHPYCDVFKGCELKMLDEQGNVIKNYEYIEEFIPGSTSGNGEVKAEVVYVGYGITAPELDYDDYAGIDVKGKIVLMDREVPMGTEHEDFLKWRNYSFHQYKFWNAVKHGAAGMLYNYPIANPNNDYSEGFLLTHIGQNEVDGIFEGTKKNHAKLKKKIQKKLKPQSFNTGKTMLIKNLTKHHPDAVGSNVIGFIEGSDPELKNEFIVVGGHLDFLGRCYEIMPGANDNASAVSVTMGLAKALGTGEIKLKRSVVFFLIGAEEAGLKGVQYFLKNPTISLDNIAGFINMDGVGIGSKIGVGFAKNQPTFYSFLEKANEQSVKVEMGGGHWNYIARPRLDAAFFSWYGIPVLTLWTSGKTEKEDNYRYHTPYDNISNITPEIMEKLTKILYLSIVDMGNADKLDFKRGEKKPEFIEVPDFKDILIKK